MRDRSVLLRGQSPGEHCVRLLTSTTGMQAQEDNEMDLNEGELIEQIEQLDEGWWSGVGPGGKQGLFPGA